jgi:rhodanese-related sulfurtransferase
MINNLSTEELRSWIKNGNEFTLIDVREPWEHEDFNIGGKLIPLNELSQRFIEIPTNHPVVFYCKKGIRSVIALQKICDKLPAGLALYNLSGGVEAWQRLQD